MEYQCVWEIACKVQSDGMIPPLSAPGLVLKGRLEAVVQSLDRVEEKRGSRPS